MLWYSVEVKIVGSGKFFRFKRNTKVPSINWSYYLEGGKVFRFGDDCYEFRSPRIPHLLCWYFEKYHVEYSVTYRGNTFSWKNFFGLKHLHLENGDIVIDINNNRRYLMVNNPSTGQIEHHEIYECVRINEDE